MACFSEDCNFVKKNGDCFYDGVPPSNSPKTCEECRFFKAAANYERLIHKTPEELAGWFGTHACCMAEPFLCNKQGGSCKVCWLDWLKQEVGE